MTFDPRQGGGEMGHRGDGVEAVVPWVDPAPGSEVRSQSRSAPRNAVRDPRETRTRRKGVKIVIARDMWLTGFDVPCGGGQKGEG
jgi:hypothetical protein